MIKVELQLLWGEGTQFRTRLKAVGLIERLNLTLRPGVALLTRRTWGTAQHASELALPVQWWRGYYDFARYHEALRIQLVTARLRKGKQRACQYRSQTPAMTGGLTTHR